MRFKATICISAPTTRQEVCSRLWPSSSSKTLNTIQSLWCRQRQVRTDKGFSVPEPRTSNWGWVIRPNNRSVVARQRYRSLDGGCKEDSMWRATRIREFPENAVMKRRMLTAKKQIDDYCWSPPTKEGEHSSSWNDFVWLLPLLKFVVDIILSSAFPLSCRSLFFQRKIAARITESLLPNQQSHQNLLYLKLFFPETLGCLFYEIATKGKYRNIC